MNQSREYRIRFINEKVVKKGHLFLIKHIDASDVLRKGFATFDDPTSDEHSGPVRTLLAFTNEDHCGRYIESELNGYGSIYRVDLNKAGIFKLSKMMINSQIEFFTFDRETDSKGASCTFVRLKLLLDVLFVSIKGIDSIEAYVPKNGKIIDVTGKLRNN